MTPDYYYYLSQSDTYKVDGTDDRSDFSETVVSTNGHSSSGILRCYKLGHWDPEGGRDLLQGTQRAGERGKTGVRGS